MVGNKVTISNADIKCSCPRCHEHFYFVPESLKAYYKECVSSFEAYCPFCFHSFIIDVTENKEWHGGDPEILPDNNKIYDIIYAGSEKCRDEFLASFQAIFPEAELSIFWRDVYDYCIEIGLPADQCRAYYSFILNNGWEKSSVMLVHGIKSGEPVECLSIIKSLLDSSFD